MTLYNQLKQLINKHNLTYQVYKHKIKEQPTMKEVLVKRDSFISRYAREIHEFIWVHKDELTKQDFVVLDGVPTPVWNTVPGTCSLMVDVIKNIRVK